MWYILSAEEGAGIYCGLFREEFVARVRNGCIQDCLNFMNVHRGDCFLIEAGTMYAIGAGSVILEVQ